MTQSMFALDGRVAVVTGACGLLGTQYVGAMVAAGARVVAFDLKPPGPGSPLSSIGEDRFHYEQVDITSRAAVEVGLDAATKRFGEPGILVNNAAIDAPPGAAETDTGPFESYPESSWQAMMDVNLKGMLFCCQVIGGRMAQGQGGAIINIASIYGLLSPDQRIYAYRQQLTGQPFFKPVAYSVTKSGVLNLTRYLATYWAQRKVRVNTLTLGGVFNGQDETFLRNYGEKVPMGRMADPHEFNGALVFLASDASAYMTGANLVIDGGFSAW